MGNFRRHANAFAQRGVRVDGLADVHRVGAHFDGQGDLANHVARVGAHDAAAQNLAVAMGFGRVVEQQLGVALVAAIGNGAARGRPGEQALLDLDALGLGLVFGQADPCHFGVGVGHRWDHAGVEGGADEKALLATWESARAKEKARQEAREAEQARLTAIESEKRRKQEQARFDAAMNAKDPQAMYLAAGKYEREGDSYSARKVYEQIIDRFPSSTFAAKANDQLLANQRSDRARSDLFQAQQDAQRQQGERAFQACQEEVDACNTRTNYKGKCWRDCNSLR